MRRSSNRGHRMHGCWGTRDRNAQPTVLQLYCTRNGQREALAAPTHRNPRPQRNLSILVPPRARQEWERNTIHRPEPQRPRTSCRQSSTKSHGRRIRDCKQTSTSMTMTPSPPSWAPTTGPATTSAQWPMAQNREATSPAADPPSASYQAHLRRNYAALGSVAAAHTTTAGNGHAGG